MSKETSITTIPESKPTVKKQAITNFSNIPSTEISKVLNIYKDSITQLVNNPERASRFIQVITTIISKNQKLAECNIKSIVGGMLQAAMLNLDFNPSLGECYLVPYGNEAQFQLGYRGMITLAHRGDQLSEIYAECIYEGDDYLIEYGLNRTLNHEPKFKHINDSSKIKYAYAVAKSKTGGIYFKVLSISEIEALRKRSPSQKYGVSGAWKTDYAAMAMAKAIKQLSKFLPLSVEYNYAIASDGMIIKQTNDNSIEMELPPDINDIPEAEIIPEQIPNPQGELSDEEWFKKNEEAIKQQEKLFESGK